MSLTDVLLLGVIGFGAQLVDGAAGMGFGLVAMSTLSYWGLHPLQASAMTHVAKVASGAFAAGSHLWHRNVDWRLVAWLSLGGAIGAALGVAVLRNTPLDWLRALIFGYVAAMGCFVLARQFLATPKRAQPNGTGFVLTLGFFGGLLDAVGGGGWGPIVTSTLLYRNTEARFAVGTVVASEVAVSLVVALLAAPNVELEAIGPVAALVGGGIVAAPLVGHIVKRAPSRAIAAFAASVIVVAGGAGLARTLGMI
jgi:hypothetical protein